MQKLLIKGGKKLSGEVVISGSKNASLPIVISSLLFDDSVQFENVPKVKDIYTLINLIKVLGRESTVSIIPLDPKSWRVEPVLIGLTSYLPG